MIEIDDVIRGSIDPGVWKKLHPTKKIQILRLLTQVKNIINSPPFS